METCVDWLMSLSVYMLPTLILSGLSHYGIINRMNTQASLREGLSMNCSTVDSAGPFFFSLRVVGCTFEKVFFDSLLEAVLMGYIVAVLTSRML